ncbi:hypothetical protein SLEP1_g16845 [Rubroshorea leprosula]|uniref:Reverse transcriptase zinc-binding domain-containing protein n=1 Tax=Rubroshorea leprosula TaxID=152421 RepID=A0AAV5IS77_9ROSI|nr:hypothetical protein SLEP1_g16845 [Rubroshorea leprosula]
MVTAAIEKQLYKGVKVGNDDIMVSHLQFADDTIFFEEATDENIWAIKRIVRSFELVSGLKINYAKSQLMGVRELRKFNLALMGKWWGRLARKEQGLWDKVIASKYGGSGGHWLDWVREGRGIGSLWWRDVGCLNNVDEEKEGWLTEGKEKKCCQMGNEEDGTWRWNLEWRRALFDWEREEAAELQRKIDSMRIYKDTPDTWKISTKSNLQRRGITTELEDGICALCEEEVEDSNHLFLRCKVAKWLWKACGKWWGISVNLENDCWKSFEQFGGLEPYLAEKVNMIGGMD